MKKLTIFFFLFPFMALASFSSYTVEISPDSQFIESSPKIAPWGVLSVTDTVLGMVEEAGFDPELAKAVIQCESGWFTEAHNWNDPNGGSHGLWQLNGIHGLTMEDMLDPYRSTEKAIELLQSSRSWNHWSCYQKVL